MSEKKSHKRAAIASLTVMRLDVDGARAKVSRSVPAEVPLALTYNGVPFSVMMVTPEDLEDYARGFSLNEGIIDKLDELSLLEISKIEAGYLAHMEIPAERREAMRARRRNIWDKPVADFAV